METAGLIVVFFAWVFSGFANLVLIVKTIQLPLTKFSRLQFEDVVMWGKPSYLILYIGPAISFGISATMLGENPIFPVLTASIIPVIAAVVHGLCYLIYRTGKKTS